ncbi:MAG: hypothetical protein KTR32_08365, partial [Granulosicoccus sp.]|nr:hypothetical protein [Granulosicoccus sp.]
MFYTHSSLDRADHLRKEKSNLSRIRLQADSLLIPVWRGQSLTSIPDGSTQPKALVLNSIELRDHDTVFLGLNNSSHYFAVDVSAMDEPERDHLIQRAKSPGGEQIAGQFNDLRSIGPLLSQDDGSLLAYARGMIYWNSTTCYCYRCGTALQHHFHGHHKQCTNQDCGYVLFPRTDPAVIMLVIYKPLDGSAEQCLLGRSPAWPDGVYST